MADDLISGNSLLRAAEAIRAKRAAERAQPAAEAQPIRQITNSAQVRAQLNVYPDESMLASLINHALTALSRGVRWARGSIINLIV